MAEQPSPRLFDASGAARRPAASPLFATGALLAGFVGLDAPAGPRAAWQAASAPRIGLAAALGILSSQSALAAVVAMGMLGAVAGAPEPPCART